MQSDIPSDLQGASNFSMKLVERLKPYQGANNPFWRIHDLDIIDKHRLLLIVAASHTSMRVIFDTDAIFAKMLPPWGSPSQI